MSVLATAAVVWTPGLPLALAAVALVPGWARAVAAVAWWLAPAPALVAALAPPGSLEEGSILLGAHLQTGDALTRGLLLAAAPIWCATGRFARTYVADSPRRDSFWFFFLMTMAGTHGAIVSADVATFYLCYALMTFAAYGLIVHERTADARRAGRVYLALALLGEVLLLAAFWLVAQEDIDVPLADVPRRVASSPHRVLVVALLLGGFGVKAGAFPLHVWLPLAHPVAPAPASAVLSGLLVKAGLLGWLRFLPLGEIAVPELAWPLGVTGLVTVFFGGVLSVAQNEAKTVLAYSTVSQMGIATAVLAVALGEPSTSERLKIALVVFAMHHGLAKAALFLGAAVASEAGTVRARRLVATGLALPALAIAGAPLTTGAVAKAALAAVIEGAFAGSAALAVSLSLGAVGSALLMVRFLAIAPSPQARAGVAPRRGLWLPWVVLVAAGNGLFLAGAPPTGALARVGSAGKLWAAIWPVAAGLTVAFLGWRWRARRLRRLRLPAGDLVVWADAARRRVRSRLAPLAARARARRRRVDVRGWLAEAASVPELRRWVVEAEARLAVMRPIGLLLLALVVALAGLLWR